ncbi:vitellogenin receptor-like [Planococcus citri]|uniref:vitellogenin receptor-like n=1 Tax=Planococcus citri TaxID=170843 RepID=UPI0031F9610B
MCNKILSRFLPKCWPISPLMRFLVIFCLFCVVISNVECVKNLSRSNLPGEENKHVDGKNTEDEHSPIRLDLVDCSVHNGRFLCEDKRKCIKLSDTCNDECDCFDCSDESDLCWEYNEIICRSCDHLCFPSPRGSTCLSNNNTRQVSSLDLQECGPDAVCDQKCVMYEGIERCSCKENYRGKPGTKGKECVSHVSYENLLLYSTSKEIKLLNFTANETRVIRKDVQCTCLAAAGDYLYYGIEDKKYKGYVYKSSIRTGETDLIINTTYKGSARIYTIDIDWITGNIYFSTNQFIGVCSEDGAFCTRVKSLGEADLCHIGLAPRSGLLFTAMGAVFHHHPYSRILKTSMDGSNQIPIYDGDIPHPISLTVDESSEKVFWIDSDLGEIQSIGFGGKNWKKIFRSSPFNVFTISAFESSLFWTEENKNTIGMNFDNSTKFIIDKNATSVKYLYAFNPVLQRNKISNPCTNSGCNGLCLLRPSSDEGFLNFTCLVPCDNTKSSSRQKWCNNTFIPHGPYSNEDYGDYGDYNYDSQPSQPSQIEEGWREKGSKDIPSQPPQTEGRLTLFVILAIIVGCLIVLTGVLIYFVFRRKRFCMNNQYSQMDVPSVVYSTLQRNQTVIE